MRADPRRYALVLTDQNMPGLNGLLLASLIRKIRPELPVVMMTGYNEALLVEGIKAAGIRHLLLKVKGQPLVEDLLMTLLQSTVGLIGAEYQR